MTGKTWCIGAVAVLLATAAGSAAPLNLTQQNPDLSVTDLDVAYDADSNSLTLSGFLSSYTDAGGFQWNASGTYALTAQVENDGTLVSGTAGVSATGAVLDPCTGAVQISGLLVDVSLTDFGWATQSSTIILEFLADDPGDMTGALAGAFGGSLGIIADAGDLIGLNMADPFSQDWTGSDGRADNFIPEPTCLALIAGGLIPALRRRRRKR